jgi:ABC-type branched-subunit amino acid transport system substrate-binding protein
VGRRALAAVVAVAAAASVAACGQDAEPRVPGGVLDVYVSAPLHGPSARAGAAVVAGARRALHRHGGRAGGRRVHIVALSSNRPGDPDWDPGTVEANAERAADDPHAIAYVGEMDRGGSAVSVPRTNREGLLQVAPADGLTSLTRRPPGRPRAGPERYYPDKHRTFLRLVPTDLVVAREMVALAAPERRTRVAIVETADFAQHELGTVLEQELRRAGSPPVAGLAVRDDPSAVPDTVQKVVASRPSAVLVAGDPGPVSRPLMRSLAARLPGTRLITSPELAGQRQEGGARAVSGLMPGRVQPAAARRALAAMGDRSSPEATYGYDAMSVVLGAVSAAGGDRPAVVAHALRPRRVTGLTGRYTVVRGGDVERPYLAVVSLDDGATTLRPPPR